MTRRPPISPLFPYTTLSRSDGRVHIQGHGVGARRINDRVVRRIWNAGSPFTGIAPIAIHGILPTSKLDRRDRKSTRLNSSHLVISYAVFCLKKKKKQDMIYP